MKNRPIKISKAILVILVLFCYLHNPDRYSALGAAPYEIGGFFLGATPRELNITIDADSMDEEKYYETDAGGIQLFFVKVEGHFRLYRIIKEQDIKSDTVISVLDNLKARYGTPDSQQIKTSSIRPQNRAQYITTVKNRAVWNISESQEFIAEIESTRVVYELLDNDPEKIRSSDKSDASAGDGSRPKGWQSDF